MHAGVMSVSQCASDCGSPGVDGVLALIELPCRFKTDLFFALFFNGAENLTPGVM
jgi:hypothetical protein